MSIIDLSIIIFYLISMVFIGFYFQKKASQGIDSYFLGNKTLPWWALGASGMASNLDISGTMISIALIYALGASGFFIEIRGGLVLIMAFLMIFMGKWNRRANVMTLAEWMEFRFGSGREGKFARLISAIAILMSTIPIVAYFAIGSGKFLAEFMEIPDFFGIRAEFWAGLIMITIAMLYTVTSGLYGVVWTDVFQGAFIFISIVSVCIMTFLFYDIPEKFFTSIPMKDGSFLAVEQSIDNWTNIIPKFTLGLPAESSYAIYNLFGIAIIFYLIKVIIEGSGGTGGYMMQRFYASRSERDGGLLSLFWILLLSFRWPFVIAVAILGINLGIEQGEIIADPEKVLPAVIVNLIPIGLKGLLIAGMMAAAMSTFDSIVNSGASYWVKDIYQGFINPKANEKQLVFQSRLSSILIVVIGLVLTLGLTSINEIWGWLTMGIGSGLIIPLLIRWYWWRFNGYGFALGIIFGMISAILQKYFYPELTEYGQFFIVSGLSLIGSIIGTVLTKPTDEEVLLTFYKTTRPFGFWKPIKDKIGKEEKNEIRKENLRDIISVSIALPWQIVLFLTPLTLITKSWDYFIFLSIILVILSIMLYFTWFRNLAKEKESLS